MVDTENFKSLYSLDLDQPFKPADQDPYFFTMQWFYNNYIEIMTRDWLKIPDYFIWNLKRKVSEFFKGINCNKSSKAWFDIFFQLKNADRRWYKFSLIQILNKNTAH